MEQLEVKIQFVVTFVDLGMNERIGDEYFLLVRGHQRSKTSPMRLYECTFSVGGQGITKESYIINFTKLGTWRNTKLWRVIIGVFLHF